MKCFELTITINLNIDVVLRELPEKLSKAINFYFLSDEDLKKFHKEKHVKLYSFSSFFPLEKDKKYKKGLQYIFKMRFWEQEIAEKFVDLLYDEKNYLFQTISVSLNQRHSITKINTLRTVTPAVLTIDKKYWKRNDEELEFVKERILKNTNRKYNYINNSTEPVHDFIENITIDNRVPIAHSYKSGYVIGNKFTLTIKQDELSQKLAEVVFVNGLLEKNSLSFGFCLQNGECLI